MLNFVICLSFAVLIEGTVYDESLNKIPAVITIKKNNLIYSQLTTKDGEYAVQIPAGNYTFVVWNRDRNLTSTYKLTIEEDSIFDFVLLPSQYQPIDIPEIVSIEEMHEEFPELYEVEKAPSLNLVFVAIAIIILLIILFYFYIKKKSDEIAQKLRKEIEEIRQKSSAKEYLNDTERVYQLIQEKGEIPQKEIVSKMGFSKAKVTLILEKLEKMGKIERLTIGREKIVRKK
jgi:uncharacterized membrane protein